jgi:predicted DsbA family dithiol-disulfide isomerase
MTPLEITLFTDPACPFAFSAEPVRIRLRWHYGDGLRWRVRMIVLTREPGEAEKLAEGAPNLQRIHGMPIDPRPYPRPASSEPACRAFVAAREHAPERAEALLRRLRVRVMTGGLVDDPELIRAAAADAGLEPDALEGWAATGAVGEALEADAAAARHPLPAARALQHKLGGPDGERRYTAPSYVIAARPAPRGRGEDRSAGGFSIPGFNPVEVYETAIANLAPELPRRPRPASPAELLEWAGIPLATAEVAAVMGTDRERAREALRAGGANEQPAGADAYWSA